MVEFTDRASVEAWCEGRTREEVVLFAGLNAAMVLPYARGTKNSGEISFHLVHDRIVLDALVTAYELEHSFERLTTRSWPFGFFSREVFISAAKTTIADLAAEGNHFAVDCAFAAADLTYASGGFPSSADFSLASVLANRIEFGGIDGALSVPLLSGDMPVNLLDYWGRIRGERLENPKVWEFWVDWYEGILAGRAPDWELWREVALIDNAIWEAGPEAVAEAIEGVKAELASARLPLAEDLVADPETGLFSVVPRAVANLPLLAASLGQVRDAVEDVLAEPSNGLREDSADIRKLKRTVERYANDPQRVEMDMTVVSASLLGQVAREDLPASSAILALQQVVQQTADGIRATHPEIAANRELLRGQARKALSDDAIAQIAEAGPLLEAISEGGLSDEMHDDVFALTEEMGVGAPLLGGVIRNGGDEIVRIGGRSTRIMLMLRKSPELVHKLEGSTGYKAVSIVGTIGGLVALLLTVFL